VVVTHHVEEVPATFTHALLMREGRAVAAGPAGDVLVSAVVSEAFGMPIVVDRVDGRWFARRASE
jgi:iron complex transport system ATP-binding protein